MGRSRGLERVISAKRAMARMEALTGTEPGPHKG